MNITRILTLKREEGGRKRREKERVTNSSGTSESLRRAIKRVRNNKGTGLGSEFN